MNGRMISERTTVSLAAAKVRGRVGGRPTVMTPERIAVAQSMRAQKATWETIATTLRVGSASVRRALATAPTAEPERSGSPDRLFYGVARTLCQRTTSAVL